MKVLAVLLILGLTFGKIDKDEVVYASEVGWHGDCLLTNNEYQSPIDFNTEWDEDNYTLNDRLNFDASHFLTVKKVKNHYEENIVWVKKETSDFKITRHDHYDYDEFDYTTFKPSSEDDYNI